MMNSLLSFSMLVLSIVSSGYAQEKWVQPDQPVVEKEGVSKKVTCGTLFETGRLMMDKNLDLVVPQEATVEEYDGDSVQFFLTKTMRCIGHPPAPMRIQDVRRYFGIACQKSKEKLVIATFGEWTNRGGAAKVKLLVLVPRGTSVKQIAKLSGETSRAATEMDFGDKRMEESYWYSGVDPKEGWEAISTEIHQNRFLNPKD